MNSTLENLRELNKNIPLFSVLDPEFSAYGRVLQLPDTSRLQEVMAALPIPEQGNVYKASAACLEELELCDDIRRHVFGGMDTQFGYCNGRGFKLNALEYHKSAR